MGNPAAPLDLTLIRQSQGHSDVEGIYCKEAHTGNMLLFKTNYL